MTKEQKQLVKDKLAEIDELLSDEMWKGHSRLGKNYSYKGDQIKDALRVGKLAEAIKAIRDAKSNVWDVEEITPEKS